MRLFRSEEMQLCRLLIPAESAHETVLELGELCLVQLRDLNADQPYFQRLYSKQVQRCQDMAGVLRHLTQQVYDAGITTDASYEPKSTISLDDSQTQLEEADELITELNANNKQLLRAYAELREFELVLERGKEFFEQAEEATDLAAGSTAGPDEPGEIAAAPSQDLEEALQPPETPCTTRRSAWQPPTGFIAGTIASDKLPPFQRLLFRATRGNAYLRSADAGEVLDPAAGRMAHKAVFVVFFPGSYACQRILKICNAFGANVHPFPEDPEVRKRLAREITARVKEVHTTIDAGKQELARELGSLAGRLAGWAALLKREKAAHHALNLLSVDASRKVLVGEAWCPAAHRGDLAAALQRAHLRSRSQVPPVAQPVVTYLTPPTFFEPGLTTSAFQGLVDAYGTPRYREVNPAVFTIVTFPFLFALMFGDVGHGALLLLFAGWLVAREAELGRQQLNEILEICFKGRYIILLMSIFAIYVGVIYNECFSIPIKLFGDPHWACPNNPAIRSRLQLAFHPDLCPSGDRAVAFARVHPGPYPVGVDPIWRDSRNELSMLNSLKMKMSILVGVAHMNLGILLSLLNQRLFRDALSAAFEFVPHIVFFNALFGYLAGLIVAKWVSGSTADLYHIMISMFLNPGDVDCGGACPQNRMFPGQNRVQVALLLAAFAAVPTMLLPKPLILRARHRRREAQLRGSYAALAGSPEEAPRSDEPPDPLVGHGVTPSASATGSPGDPAPHDHAGGHGFDFGEIMVHQMIHTIEFVLGAVSNTASYLRLWALSLAHSQLSAVFYERGLLAAIKTGNVVVILAGSFAFVLATLGVLMVMETLSAFLHALRLHWVEFQNKFYHGDGYAFDPFCLPVLEKRPL